MIDDSNRRAVLFALNLLPFAGIAFLWFIGVVRDRMGEREDRFFATVFLGSGLLFVAMLFAAGAIAGALLIDSADAAEPTTEVWTYGRRITYSLVTVYAMRMAGVFMISTTTLVMRLKPRAALVGDRRLCGRRRAVADHRAAAVRRVDLPTLGAGVERAHPHRDDAQPAVAGRCATA